MDEQSPEDRDRKELLADYRAKPNILARQLEKLLTGCDSASQSTLQCEVVDLVTELCGVKVLEKDAMGDEKMSEDRFLLCKNKIAKELANTVLSFARAE